MYTKERLLEMALEADAKYEELFKQFPVGTVNKERNDAYQLSEDAMICAAWMEKHGIQEMKNIGPFHDFIPAPGSQVRVKEGTTVYSTHPSYTREGKKSKGYVVKVHDVYKGYIDHHHSGEVTNATVHWVGGSGYWKWCSLNDVEPVEG